MAMKKSILNFLFLLAMSQVSQAGDNCKDVQIAIINDIVRYNYYVGQPVVISNGSDTYPASAPLIQIIRAEYYDYNSAKWRTEALENVAIMPKGKTLYTENLEYVDDDNTKLRIVYKYQLGNTASWSSEQTSRETEDFKCIDGMQVTITLDATYP